MTAPDAMPERVWLVGWTDHETGQSTAIAQPDGTYGGVPYVPESRLREAEAERDAIADNCARASSGWIAATADFERLRAERDALRIGATSLQMRQEAEIARLTAERQGEVYEVQALEPGSFQLAIFDLDLHGFYPGDKVRVTKVEEGQ